MFKVNENFAKLPGSYLFANIAKRVSAFQAEHPEKEIIRLGIGDVTQPIARRSSRQCTKLSMRWVMRRPSAAMLRSRAMTFKKYHLQEGFQEKGCDISADEIFVSDGAKCDCGNIQELFSLDSVVAVCDPVYPVYVDSNVMAGRSGLYNSETGRFDKIVYMPCTADNGFLPEFPKEHVDLIYLCFPNNPTGEAIKKADLQAWVDFANKNGAVIIYDAAYEAYITEAGIPHSIYECEGAKTCAIELRSFSKKAGFTGMRLGFAVIPKDLKCGDVSLNAMWMRRQGSKYNGTPYIIQRAGEAVYSPEGKVQVTEQIARYMKNAKTIYDGLKDAGYTVYGGVNSPYIWLKTPNNMKSWDFFDFLLNNAGIVGTPGAGFSPSGEGYFGSLHSELMKIL